jgi:ribosomal protein S18 acetylase RimI-like enzyme
VSRSLARAFDDDPVSMYIFPDDRRRLGKLERFFRVQINRTFLRRGEGYTTPDLKGAAFWMTPTSGRAGLWEMLQQAPLLPIVGSRLVPTMSLLTLLESHHPKQPHYYLGTIGTDPDCQGRGIGSAMLQPVLDRCDADGIPAYLESSKERNLAFYRRHGFEVSGELSVADGPRLWLMWREPLGRT